MREEIGVIDQKNKKSLFIATRKAKWFDLFTMGFYPKPTYEQIGVFKGDVSGFEEGDRVKVLVNKQSFLEILTLKPNILKVEKMNNPKSNIARGRKR